MSSPHLHDIDRLLSEQGYVFVRQRASHRHYRNDHGQVVTVSVHGSHHVFDWRQVASIRADIARHDRARGEEQNEASA